MCQGEAFLTSAGLSTGALIAILLCIIILLGKLGQNLWGFQQEGAAQGQMSMDGRRGLTRAKEEKGMN